MIDQLKHRIIEFFRKQKGPSKWNDKYYFKKEWQIQIAFCLHLGVISSFLIPFLSLKIIFDLGFLADLAHYPMDNSVFWFFIGLFGSWVMVSVKITEKILLKIKYIIPKGEHPFYV